MRDDRRITSSPAPTSSPLVVGVDRSADSVGALAAAMRVAGALAAPLTVVHAVGLLEEGGYREAPPLDELVAAARRDAGMPSLAVDLVSEDGPAADVLLRVAERVGAAIVVVGRRGAGAAPRLLGSVSEAVVERSSVPVLVVPAVPPA